MNLMALSALSWGRYRCWVDKRRCRKRAIRWTVFTPIGWVAYLVMSTVLGRVGLIAQILSPNGGVKSAAAAFLGIGLLTVRVVLVVVAPPVLACAWVHALWPSRIDKGERIIDGESSVGRGRIR